MRKIFFSLLTAILIFTFNVAAAEDNNLSFDTLAVTYSEDETQALALIQKKDDGAIFFVVTDKNSDSMALIPYSPELYNFYLDKGEYGYPPLILLMMLPEQERGQLDDNLGEWDEDLHIVPVYALFEVESGQIICDKPFFSASSLESTHYHDRIQNPVYERLIEVFITHMPRLHERLEDQNISLP